MNSRQKNRLTMMMALVAICNVPAAIYHTLPDFPKLLTQLMDLIKRIQDLSLLQGHDYKGKTNHKNTLIGDLIMKTIDIGRRTVAYANANNLEALKEAVNYTESDLKRMSDQELWMACNLIFEEAGNVIGSLAPYGVTQQMLDEQKIAIGLFEKDMTSPREGAIKRKNATMALKTAYGESKPLFGMMDELVLTLKDSNPDDYNNYMNARIVVDYGKRKKSTGYSVSGTALDFENGLPLSEVHLSIVGTTTGMITDITGVYSLPVKNAGEYRVRAERSEYKIQIAEVTVTGEATNLDIEMEKDGVS
jgi:hypothetical protein